MFNIFRLFFIVAGFWFDLTKGNGRCTFEASEVDFRKMPLAYQIDEDGNPFLLYPEPDRKFIAEGNSKIMFSCLNNSFVLEKLMGEKEIEVTCVDGSMFDYDNEIYDYSLFKCDDTLRSVTTTSDRTCPPHGNTILNVGYQTKDHFFTVYSVCFDTVKMNTAYTWYKMRVPYFDSRQEENRSRYFREDITGTLNLNSIYSKSKHIKTIHQILNLNQDSSPYMDNEYHFLTRGHLTSKFDFYLAHEQAATFSYLNIFPQWNNSNRKWTNIENTIRTENAKNRNSKRVIVSGVYGSFTLLDHEQNEEELYLAVSNRQVFVPKFMWKMIYDDDNENNNVVFIGFNNPRSDALGDVDGQINCNRIPCPGTIVFHASLKLYCCDIESFQVGYGKLDDDVFNLRARVDPARAG